MVPGWLVDLGRMSYREAYERQLAAVQARQGDRQPDTLFVVEHPHVITVGRARQALANVIAAGDVEVIAVERGGDVTYHGPGQIVAYPVIQLGEGERDLHRFLRALEEAIIHTAARYGVDAGREPGKTGVWRQGRKLASIGVACRRWVTFHGLALNVTTDLSYFHRINPCGFDAAIMTSLTDELTREHASPPAINLATIKQQLAVDLGAALGRHFATPPG